jgi:hypothetical protein
MATVVGDGFALVGIQLAEGTAALVKTGPEGEVGWWESYEAATDTEEGTLFSSSLVPLEEGYVLWGYSIAGQTIDAVAIRVGADKNTTATPC